MFDISQITVCREDYLTDEAFENAVKKAVMVLLDNNYIMTIKYDDKGLGIVAIDFNPNDRSLGCDYPYWLSPFEIESVVADEEREKMESEE